jgi:hypothetical protein
VYVAAVNAKFLVYSPDVIIAVLKSVLHDMKRALEEVHTVGIQLEYFALSDDTDGDDLGTADTLRQLRDKIKVLFYIHLFLLCFATVALSPLEVTMNATPVHVRLTSSTVCCFFCQY